MTADEARKKVLDLARGEIGYRETCDNRTKYAREYDWDTRLYGFDMDGLPWCDWFVDWLFIKAFGFGTGTAMTYQHTGCSGASCACSASYYRENGIAGPATWAALAVRMPVCLRGSRNRAVAALQSALDQLGAGLDADGEFGPLTEEAVRLFQGGRI